MFDVRGLGFMLYRNSYVFGKVLQIDTVVDIPKPYIGFEQVIRIFVKALAFAEVLKEFSTNLK